MNNAVGRWWKKALSTAKTAWLLGNGRLPRQADAAGNTRFKRWRIILSRGVGHPVRSGFNVEEKEA
jgi:hypothetical protein